MASLLDYLDRGAKALGFGDTVASTLYQDSFSEDVIDFGVGAYNKVDSFLESKTGQAAKELAMQQFAKGAQFQPRGGSRISSAGKMGSTLASYAASKADLGYTAKVQDMARFANNAQAGTSIDYTVARVSGRPAKGVNIPVEYARVGGVSRSRQVS